MLQVKTSYTRNKHTLTSTMIKRLLTSETSVRSEPYTILLICLQGAQKKSVSLFTGHTVYYFNVFILCISFSLCKIRYCSEVLIFNVSLYFDWSKPRQLDNATPVISCFPLKEHKPHIQAVGYWKLSKNFLEIAIFIVIRGHLDLRSKDDYHLFHWRLPSRGQPFRVLCGMSRFQTSARGRLFWGPSWLYSRPLRKRQALLH